MDEREKRSEEAAAWILRLQNAMPEEHEELIAWLKASRENVDALIVAWNVQRITHALLLRMLTSPAPAPAAQPSVIPLRRASAGFRWRKAAIGLAAACVAVAILTAAICSVNFRSAEVLKTAYEWKELVLSDGTVVRAGPLTELYVHYSSNERLIELVKGEALFEVAKNPQRPFIVTAGMTRARAVGTQFAVAVESDDESVVTVREGVVAVKRSSDGSDTEPLRLNAGYEVHASPGHALVANPVDVDAALAWTRHRLVFHDRTVEEAVHEFNRLNRVQIELRAAPAVKRKLISADFPADKPEALGALLEKMKVASVYTEGSKIFVLAP